MAQYLPQDWNIEESLSKSKLHYEHNPWIMFDRGNHICYCVQSPYTSKKCKVYVLISVDDRNWTTLF